MECFNHNSIDMEYHQIPRIKSLQKKCDDKIYSYSVINESNKKENEKFIIGSQQYSNNEFKRNLDQLSTLNFDKNKDSSIQSIKKKNIVKNFSADKIALLKNSIFNNKLYNNHPNKHYENQNMFDKINTKRSARISADCIIESENSCDETEKRVIVDYKFCSELSAIKQSPNIININSIHKEERTEKKTNPNRQHYSHSPSSRNQEMQMIKNSFKSKEEKHNECKVIKSIEESRMRIIQKRIVKVKANMKKFPKDFFF